MTLTDIIKRQGEIAINLIAIVTCCGTMILFFGGSLPPWATPSQIKTLQEQQASTTKALNSLNDEIDRKACDDYVDRLMRASAALERNPNDPSALDLREASKETMRRIPNCVVPSQ